MDKTSEMTIKVDHCMHLAYQFSAMHILPCGTMMATPPLEPLPTAPVGKELLTPAGVQGRHSMR